MNRHATVTQFPTDRVRSISRNRQLNILLEMTEQMFNLAKSGDWEAVSDLQATRTEHLVACFDSPLPRHDIKTNAEIVVDVLALNERMVDIVKQARTDAGTQFGQLRHSHKAAVSYQETAESLY